MNRQMYKKKKVVNKSDLTIKRTSRFGIHCKCGIEKLRKNIFGVFRIIEVILVGLISLMNIRRQDLNLIIYSFNYIHSL